MKIISTKAYNAMKDEIERLKNENEFLTIENERLKIELAQKKKKPLRDEKGRFMKRN